MIGECAYARFNKQCAVRSLLARFFIVIAGVVQIKGKTGRGNRFEKALVSRIVSDCYPNEAEAIVNRNDKNWGMKLQNIIEKIERRNVDKIYIKVDGTDVHVYTNAGKFWGESPVTK